MANLTVKEELMSAKGSITYNVDYVFEYNGKIIPKSYWGMKENNVNSIE